MGDNHWEIVEHFEHPSQEAMLHALTRGTNALSFDVHEPFSEEKTKNLFQDIDTTIINLYIKGEAKAINSILQEGMNATIPLPVYLTSKSTTTANLTAHAYTFSNLDMQQEGLEFLTIVKDFMDDRLAITYHVSNNYLENIIHLRVIRLLWDHLLASTKAPKATLRIIAETKDYHQNTSMEEDMIFASTHLMSSIIGSADAILLKASPKEGHDPEFTKRITRNLHHLAVYEGKMDMQHDPLRGSYHIEKETLALAGSIWNKFKA